MKKKILLLGSTGSIGKSSLNIIRNYKSKLDIVALSTNKNIKLIIKQSKEFKVKNLIIKDFESYKKILNYRLNKKIKIFNNISDFLKNNKTKFDISIIGISGFDGLYPTLKVIPYSKNLSSANKESIICGWKFIKNKMKKYKTNFIPLDSEHFSIWSLIKNSNHKMISKIYLTASGGPFLNKSKSKINNARVSDVINHPNWNMGQKISVDSATLMNKLFELIEASKIFNLPMNKFDIIIHPKSYVHAIIKFKNGLTKIVVHDTNMKIPIFNSLYSSSNMINSKKIDLKTLNNLDFRTVDYRRFPLTKILNVLPEKSSLFETILVSINDKLVELFLDNRIKYTDISKKMHNMLRLKDLKRFKMRKVTNTNEIFKINNQIKKKVEIFVRN